MLRKVVVGCLYIMVFLNCCIEAEACGFGNAYLKFSAGRPTAFRDFTLAIALRLPSVVASH